MGLVRFSLCACTCLSLGWAIGQGWPFAVVLGALGLLAGLVLSVRRLEIVLLSAMVALLLPSTSIGAGAPWLLSIRWIVGGLAFFAVVVRMLNAGDTEASARSTPPEIFLFVALALASVGWSISLGLTLGRAATFAVMITTLVLVQSVPGARSQLRTALQVTAGLIAVGGLVAALTGARAVTGRYAGVFNSPNALGTFCALLFPLVFEQALHAGIRRRRVAAWGTAVALVAQSVAAGSRGGLLAIAAAYFFLLWRGRRGWAARRLIPFLIPVFVGVAVVIIGVEDPHRFSLTDSRTSLWSIFPEVFKSAPIVGHGFGTTQVVLAPFSARTGYLDPRGVDFHNSYLNVLSDVGLAGGLLLGVVLFRAARASARADAGMVGVVIAGTVSATFESWLLSVGSGSAFIFWFALLGVVARKRMVTPEPRAAETATAA